MQMTMDQAMRPSLAHAFANRRNSGYVMRSEKRPGYGSGSGGPNRGRRPKPPKAGWFYILITLIISVILWPLGMVMLWRRKVRMQAGTKLLLSLLTMCLCVFLIVFGLTVRVDNPKFTEYQDKANDWLNKASADLAVWGDAAYKKGSETWGVMTEFANNAASPVMNTVADGLDRAVALAGDARAFIESRVAGKDAPASTAAPIESAAPETEAPPAESLEADGEAVDIHIPANSPDPDSAQALMGGMLTAGGALKPGQVPDARPAATAAAAETADDAEDGEDLVWSAIDEAGAIETPAPTATAPTATAEAATAEAATAEAATLPTVTEKAANTTEPTATARPLMAAAEVEEVPAEAASTAEPAETPAPTDTPAPTLDVRVRPAAEAKVYYNESGKLYHMRSTCRNMPDAKAHTLGEAIDDGKQHCDVCHSPDESLLAEPHVAWVDQNGMFHTSDACAKFSGAYTLVSLNEAVNRGCTPCRTCRADKYAELYVVATPTPAPTSVPEAVTPSVTLKPAGEVIVYHSSNGKFYHRFSVCKAMSGSQPYKLSEITSKYKRCKTCDAPDTALVGKPCLWMDENGLCHTSDACEHFKGNYTLVLRDDALAQGLRGCPDCGAEEYLVPGTVLGE